MLLLCSINFCFGPVEMRQFKNNCSGLKIDWGSPPSAAIYGMRITSLHCCFTHVFADSAYKQLTMALSQAHNLLRRNNLSGGLTDDCVNNFVFLWINLLIVLYVYFTIVDETGSCRLLIMLGDGPRCKVLGDNSFSTYWSNATTGNILDTIIIIMKRKEKPTGRWHARNTHLRKSVVLSRIFKRMVPVDYSCQSKKKYPEPFLLLVQ